MKIAANGEIPTAPVLAPKMAPRISVLGKNVRAARNPSRRFRDAGAMAC